MFFQIEHFELRVLSERIKSYLAELAKTAKRKDKVIMRHGLCFFNLLVLGVLCERKRISRRARRERREES